MPPPIAARDNSTQAVKLDGSWKSGLSIEGFIIESWSQGFLVGALFIMAATTVANMRSDSVLHKLILLELFLAMFHGTFCFMTFDGYNWYLSGTATVLYMSLYLHNIIAWMKTRPFLTPLQSKVYLISFLLTLPYWILETYANFAYFNSINRLFKKTRPFEALCRDPWWVFTAVNLVYNLKTRYNFGVFSLIRVSPRFGVMLASMFLSIVFVVVDIIFAAANFGGLAGINPYWKFSLVLKCLCDTLILDDFRSALEKVRTAHFNHVNKGGMHDKYRQQSLSQQGDRAGALDSAQRSRKGSLGKNLVPAFVSRNGDRMVMLPHGTAVAIPKGFASESAKSMGRQTADGILKVNGIATDVSVLSPHELEMESGLYNHRHDETLLPEERTAALQRSRQESLHDDRSDDSRRILVNTDIIVDRRERTSRQETYGNVAGAGGRR